MRLFVSRAARLLAIWLLALPACDGEDWPGYEGGGPRRNASAVDIVPDRLSVSWIRRFDRQVVIGRNLDPVPHEQRLKWGALNGAFGSRNLVLMDGRLALIAAGHDQPIQAGAGDTAWLTLLDHTTGKTVNCIQVAVSKGKAGVWGWPQAPWTDANDLLIGQVVLDWDRERNACFVSVGGDGARYTAYLPAANLDGYAPGGFQMGVPAFQEIVENHSQLQDAFGRPRAELVSLHSPAGPQPAGPAEAAHWGPSLVPKDAEGRHTAIDNRLPILLPPGAPVPEPNTMASGLYQNNVFNRTAFVAIDAEGPGIAMGQSWHADACSYYIANKWTGLYGMAEPLPPLRLVDEDGNTAAYPHARPFAKWGGFLAHRNRLYGMSPGTDDDRSGELGLVNGAGWQTRRRDQGLGLWAYDLKWEDRQANDGATGAAAAETATARLAWGWSRKSHSREEAINESWLEADGLYRNKAMLVDDQGALWATWTRSVADGMELVRADESGQKGWLLGIGKGRAGHETWPHLAMAKLGSKRLIISYAGNAWRRARVPYRLTHSNCAEKEGALIQDAWGETDEPPSGPPELAVFDAASGSVVARLDLGKFADDLPPNEFFGYTDRSHLVVAGRFAYVGWVGTKNQGEAELVLAAVDLEKPGAGPVIRRFQLGFPAETNPASALIDLIAADGRLHALIYRSDALTYGDQRWYEQVLVSLAGP